MDGYKYKKHFETKPHHHSIRGDDLSFFSTKGYKLPILGL